MTKEDKPKKIRLKPFARLPDKHKDLANDDYIIKLIRIYNSNLSSGVDNVTCVCNYSGLTQLALSHHTIHPSIKPIINKHETQRTQGEKDIIVAYGYQVLMGNV